MVSRHLREHSFGALVAPPVAPVQNEKENVSEWIQGAGSCKSCAVMIGNNIIHDEYEYHQCNM